MGGKKNNTTNQESNKGLVSRIHKKTPTTQ